MMPATSPEPYWISIGSWLVVKEVEALESKAFSMPLHPVVHCDDASLQVER